MKTLSSALLVASALVLASNVSFANDNCAYLQKIAPTSIPAYFQYNYLEGQGTLHIKNNGGVISFLLTTNSRILNKSGKAVNLTLTTNGITCHEVGPYGKIVSHVASNTGHTANTIPHESKITKPSSSAKGFISLKTTTDFPVGIIGFLNPV